MVKQYSKVHMQANQVCIIVNGIDIDSLLIEFFYQVEFQVEVYLVEVEEEKDKNRPLKMVVSRFRV